MKKFEELINDNSNNQDILKLTNKIYCIENECTNIFGSNDDFLTEILNHISLNIPDFFKGSIANI